MKETADSVVEERRAVQAKWIPLVGALQKTDEVIFAKEHVRTIVKGFSEFGGKKPGSEIREASRHLGGTGQLVLMEEEGGEYYVFPNPEKIVDSVRQITGPEELVLRILEWGDARRLKNGLLSKNE